VLITIENRGSRPVTVRRMALEIDRDGNRLTLPAQTYIPDPLKSETQYPLGHIWLQPDEDWSEIAVFFQEFSRSNERRAREFINDIRTEIQSQVVASGGPKDKPYEASEDLVAAAKGFFDEHFLWEDGEYRATLRLECEPASSSVAVRYRFTLFESDIETLRREVDSYKYGAGIYYSGGQGISVPFISEIGQ
jgi:hypothetical protein